MMGIDVPPELRAISEIEDMQDYLATDILDDPRLTLELTFNHTSIDECIRETLINYLNLLQQTSPYVVKYFERDGTDYIYITKIPSWLLHGIVGRA